MRLFGDLAKVLKTKDAGVMLVGENEVQGVSADNGGRVDLDVLRYRIVNEHLLARPFIYAHRAWASAAQCEGIVASFTLIRPLDCELGVGFFNDLNWFYHFFLAKDRSVLWKYLPICN